MAAGTPVVVRLDSDFNSDNATVGEMLTATVVSPVTSEGNVVVQRGASAQVKVLQIDKSGKMSGKSRVQFALVGLTAHGKLLHVSGSSKELDGPSQGARTAGETGIAPPPALPSARCRSSLSSCRHWAAAGAGAGGATGAFTSHPAPVKVTAETVLQFRLTKGIPTGS